MMNLNKEYIIAIIIATIIGYSSIIGYSFGYTNSVGYRELNHAYLEGRLDALIGINEELNKRKGVKL